VAVPALHPGDGSGPAYGLQPTSLLLEAPWLESAPESAPDGRPFPVPAGSIAALAVLRRAFDSVGGFDEGLTGGGAEDVDLCLRLRRAGWECWAVPRSRVRMAFETLPADPGDVLADTLRLGAVHLSRDGVREQVAALAGLDVLPAALSRVTAGDAGRRRGVVAARSWFDLDDLPVPTAASVAVDAARGAAT
jgi:hypothetical protein